MAEPAMSQAERKKKSRLLQGVSEYLAGYPHAESSWELTENIIFIFIFVQ